ncbi:hypothetical protein HanIR_Chr05g0209331 [Helianthus annuus]|nr:hypothetical protein HanIR_Chr05g0209331 [Helianthus annuus]
MILLNRTDLFQVLKISRRIIKQVSESDLQGFYQFHPSQNFTFHSLAGKRLIPL